MIFRTIAHAADIVSGVCRLPDTNHDVDYLLDRDKKALERANEKAERKAAEAQQWTTLAAAFAPLVAQIIGKVEDKTSYVACEPPRADDSQSVMDDHARFEGIVQTLIDAIIDMRNRLVAVESKLGAPPRPVAVPDPFTPKPPIA